MWQLSLTRDAFCRSVTITSGVPYEARESVLRTIHAEVSAIKNFPANLRHLLPKCYIIVIQWDKRIDELKMSKPCKNCNNAIINSGIKKIYWSCEDGSIFQHK